jgi:DNA-binding NarL/FixJ family response regulator
MLLLIRVPLIRGRQTVNNRVVMEREEATVVSDMDGRASYLTVVDDGYATATPGAAVPVEVHAADPVSEIGVSTQLRPQAAVRIVDASDASATVALVIADVADEALIRRLRALHRERGLAIVLVIGQLDPRALVAVVDSGVCAVVPRAESTPERLVQVVQGAARGKAELPPQLLRHLLDQVGRLNRDLLEPRGLSFAGLTRREQDVLELVADGLSTREVAVRLAYSERTIKNVLQDLTVRLHLRNRTQAVAYAVRNGWI